MASLEHFVRNIKPALDLFLSQPSTEALANLEQELTSFNWIQMKIFHVHVLAPLLLKLEAMVGSEQELRTGILRCIGLVTSKLYLRELKEMRTMLVIVLKQVRDLGNACALKNLSEEIKMAAVDCIAAVFERSATDILEAFYTKESAALVGEILLMLVEYIEGEKYRKLVIRSMECLMAVLYVHDRADLMDVVLRNQVADTMFIYLPKVVSVLFKSTLLDDKFGETMKSTGITAVGRILCLFFEETNDSVVKRSYDMSEFKQLIDEVLVQPKGDMLPQSLGECTLLDKTNRAELPEKLKRLQTMGRNDQWFSMTSQRIQPYLVETVMLRSHQSQPIRVAYAKMCCKLIESCCQHMRVNFQLLLENVIAMSEDEDTEVRRLCSNTLKELQSNDSSAIFDEKAELLLDEHLQKLPRIINRSDDDEQYAEFLFLKGFLGNLSSAKLQQLFIVPKNAEMLSFCLISAVQLQATRDLLHEELSLRHVTDQSEFVECAKLRWRHFRHLNSQRCIQIVIDICALLGSIEVLNAIIFDYLLELMNEQTKAMNELLLIMLWMSTTGKNPPKTSADLGFAGTLIEEVLEEKHWHLALQPDRTYRLKVDRPTQWFEERTPGLYESAVEIRKQDYDSDDEDDGLVQSRVTIADAQFNVLHTCIILDVFGHCATFLGECLDKYIFRSLHKVLLKVASANAAVHQAATFALISMQKALHFMEISHLIETNTDYISYHLNTILKRTPDSNGAVDILTVVLQFSSARALPHLDSIFQTIRLECAKASQAENLDCYLRVFQAFLSHLNRWQARSEHEIDNMSMNVDAQEESNLLNDWLSIIEKAEIPLDDEIKGSSPIPNAEDNPTQANEGNEETEENNFEQCGVKEKELPHYIVMAKEIIEQALKFVSSSERTYQILALECLISGVPLLKNYDEELLPLVHLMWQPLVEKFRQKDALVLNRCFSLLNVLATHAKEFILKRSLDDVIPFLRVFLREAAVHSATETMKSHTQEYKLQLKLLQELPNLIQSMQIDGKHLNEIMEVVVLYLSAKQPQQFQYSAIEFFTIIRFYDGPMSYLVVMKHCNLFDYKENANRIFGIWK